MNFILPSAESNFLDNNQTAPMNQRYPSPIDLFTPTYSGVYATFPSQELKFSNEESGVFHYNQLSGQFSNYSQFEAIKNNFQSFNTYIHYYPKNVNELDDITTNNMNKDRGLRIPYLSSYRINTFTFNPYKALF